MANNDDSHRKVMTVPGIGPIISSAMIAAIGSGAAFARGRDFRPGLATAIKDRPLVATRQPNGGNWEIRVSGPIRSRNPKSSPRQAGKRASRDVACWHLSTFTALRYYLQRRQLLRSMNLVEVWSRVWIADHDLTLRADIDRRTIAGLTGGRLLAAETANVQRLDQSGPR